MCQSNVERHWTNTKRKIENGTLTEMWGFFMSKKIWFLDMNEMLFGFKFIVKKLQSSSWKLVWLWPNIISQ
jgi:hypothetical protein